MVNEMKQVIDKLDVIKSEIDYIKKHMFDPDTIMTTEEGKRFEQSMKELKEGKTTPLSKLKKELGL
jgi:nicotinic acid phosphoribosyltransferase